MSSSSPSVSPPPSSPPASPSCSSVSAASRCSSSTVFAPDLSPHFNDPFLSDFQLTLTSPEGKEFARFHVHGIVLAGQSGYFKSLLQNWMASGSQALSLTVSEEELPAAKAMLVAAYANSVPKDADPDQLLATMVLADRYQLRVCVEACRSHLLGLDLKRLSWATALAMLRLPAGLRESQAFAAVTEKAHERVLESFANLDEAWTSRSSRGQWLGLPCEAVERVLGAVQLNAASENVVYIVAASWLAAQLKQCAADPSRLSQLQAFARSLLCSMRYAHMSGNFLAAVASHHGLLVGQAEVARWLLEAMQWSRAAEAQRKEMAVGLANCVLTHPVVGRVWRGRAHQRRAAEPQHEQLACRRKEGLCAWCCTHACVGRAAGALCKCDWIAQTCL
ncbi:hypothetical protein COO60DRAFT_123779 [Scenedesmus sp. NREL 46B-D3]|nr:hypothetical protein COO60DRAFT_123779 [Scenedesmus sp. NREL 46B-D3]